MQIKIICVGKLKEKYLQEGIKEYLKRLGAYAKVEIIEVPDEKTLEGASMALEEQIKAKEAEAIRKHIKQDTTLTALAIEGKQLGSEELAEKMARWSLEGKSHLTLVIGGSLGLDKNLLQDAELLLSFSKMTFPHQLMRLILLEQLYRAYKINRGEPYHK